LVIDRIGLLPSDIRNSGQTGNVNAPQLHFEVRKGVTPLDPMRFLKGDRELTFQRRKSCSIAI
jgi:murein DD-endopeptidase MepM/ murein hydrolase activator NlpD